MNSSQSPGWVVMKFGGTSVSSAACWQTISREVCKNVADGQMVLVVVSALSQVTNLLTRLVSGVSESERDALLQQIKDKHMALLSSLDMPPPQRFASTWADFEQQARQLADAPVEPAGFASMLSFGELLSSAIAAAVLERKLGTVQWTDARNCLLVEESEAFDPLAGRCHHLPDDQLASKLSR